MRPSLQTKLFVSFMLVVALTLSAFAVGASVLVRGYFFKAKEQELVNKGYETAHLLDDFLAGRLTSAQLVDLVDRIDGFLDARIWAVDASGRMIVMSSPQGRLRVRTGERNPEPGSGQRMGQGPGQGLGQGPGAGMGMGPGMGQGRGQNQGGQAAGGMRNQAALRALLEGMAPVFRGEVLTRTFFNPYYEEDMMLVGVPVAGASGQTVGAVILNAPIRGLNDFLTRVYWAIALVGVLALALTLLIVRRLSRGIVRPLREMEATAAAMAEGSYDRRVVVTSRDEVGQLGESLNKLACELGGFVARTQQMEKVRRDFVANVSHELRTPLTIIKGYTEALRDGLVTDPEQIARYHQLIVGESERLERLISDLLDLGRLQAGHLTMETEPVPLGEVVDNVVGLLRSRAEAAQITIDWRQEPGIPPVRGNGDRLVQLLLILLDNAVKYTPAEGTITLRLAFADGRVVLTVADTGVGIPTADLPFIWDRFYKVDKAHSRSSQGTGLGLAIAREIAERHGAAIAVVSGESGGTTFTLRFVPANNREESI